MKNIFEKQDNFVSFNDVSSKLLYGNPNAVQNPIVSIVITAYKRPDYLKECLEAAINQDCIVPYEIVVVDNNDDEGISPNQKVVEEVNNSKILYYRHEQNMGYHASANRGIQLARGEFICFCHDDDKLLKDALSTLLRIQRKTGNRAILACSADQRKHFDRYQILSIANCFIDGGLHSGALFKKSCLVELGGYNKNYTPSSDYAMNIQYCDKWGLVKCYRPTYYYRVAEGNASNTAYTKFVERDFFYRECMKTKIPLPNFYLDIVNKALYNVNKIKFSVMWGKADKILLKKIRFIDRIWIKSYSTIVNYFFSKEFEI